MNSSRKYLYGLLALIFAAAVGVTLAQESLVSAQQNDMRAVFVRDELPIGDPGSPVWDEAPQFEVPLSGQNVASPTMADASVETVRARALHNGTWVAFRLQWNDSTEDFGGGVDDFRDSVALQLPLDTGQPPFVCMGVANAAVNILHWRADFQRDIEEGYPSIDDIFPNSQANLYPLVESTAYTPAQAVGNFLAATDKPTPVEDLTANGFGTLESQDQVDTTGWGEWDGERWSVVIARPMTTGDSNDARIVPGETLPVALAAWDGDNRDVNGRKSVSSWINLELESLPGAGQPVSGVPTTHPTSAPVQYVEVPVESSSSALEWFIWGALGFMAALALAGIVVTAVTLRRRSP